MDEIELLRGIASATSPSDATRTAARARLVRAAVRLGEGTRERSRRPVRRLRLAFGAAGLAVVVLFGVAVCPVPFLPKSGPAQAASVILGRAAAAAAAKPPLQGTGYRYTKSEGAWLASVMGDRSYQMLLPITREIWIAPDGSGRIWETRGEPVFYTERDREQWIAAGSREQEAIREDFGPGGLSTGRTGGLPTEPVALRAVILARALGTSVPANVEMFIIVGDLLRETVAEPALRAALFRVASTIDGIELVGEVTDRAGRRGVALGITTDYWGGLIRRQLVFDPETWELLAEEEVVVESTEGIPAGSVIGHNTYLESRIVLALPLLVDRGPAQPWSAR